MMLQKFTNKYGPVFTLVRNHKKYRLPRIFKYYEFQY